MRRVLHVLHFDINKTIMMSDPASGASVEGMLNSVLSECVWGHPPLGHDRSQVTPDMWDMHCPNPSADPPDQGLVSFGEFLENSTNLSRSERKILKQTFTDTGCIGSRCRKHYDELLEKLKSPNTDFHGSGYYLIMPAFFRLLSTLVQRELEFRIVFRTFGHDIDNIVEEYNMFCRGTHPIFRCDNIDPRKAVDTATGIGKLTRSEDDVELRMDSKQTGDDSSEAPVIHSGMENLYRGLKSILSDERAQSIAIQDHFQYWNACGETDDSGKLLLVDPAEEDRDIAQIFFDDNIERDRAHIVDVRNAQTHAPIPFETSSGRYIHRVAPLSIILDEEYFVKAFDAVMENRQNPLAGRL